ncbi:hypothetical protein C823_004067 [Eubacterium plexicaudatum ASF492]|uniref:Uncharacterized protein n=1 Tax=Eubacterium plexicaudatum ASF492 TaxID=1235802 RepID=N2ABB5_9FIRM|nr:hypothetical protein C823_004067 [Eubacterium plexicaudatum ASF492]
MWSCPIKISAAAGKLSRTDFADIQNKNECGGADNGKDNF